MSSPARSFPPAMSYQAQSSPPAKNYPAQSSFTTMDYSAQSSAPAMSNSAQSSPPAMSFPAQCSPPVSPSLRAAIPTTAARHHWINNNIETTLVTLGGEKLDFLSHQLIDDLENVTKTAGGLADCQTVSSPTRLCHASAEDRIFYSLPKRSSPDQLRVLQDSRKHCSFHTFRGHQRPPQQHPSQQRPPQQHLSQQGLLQQPLLQKHLPQQHPPRQHPPSQQNTPHPTAAPENGQSDAPWSCQRLREEEDPSRAPSLPAGLENHPAALVPLVHP
jgi:hypothetical protein